MKKLHYSRYRYTYSDYAYQAWRKRKDDQRNSDCFVMIIIEKSDFKSPYAAAATVIQFDTHLKKTPGDRIPLYILDTENNVVTEFKTYLKLAKPRKVCTIQA